MFGERIKKMRNKRKLTQVELARLTGIEQSTLSKLERGERKGKLNQAIVLARALDTSIDYLIGATDVEYRHPTKQQKE